MCITCGNCAIYTHGHRHRHTHTYNSSAERPEQWKLIESINENMNNEGGSFTFWGLYLEWRVYTFMCWCVCVYLYSYVYSCVYFYFKNVVCCACLCVWMLENSTIVHQRSNVIYSRTTCIYSVCVYACFVWFSVYFLSFFSRFYSLCLFFLLFFPIHIVPAIIFRKSELNDFEYNTKKMIIQSKAMNSKNVKKKADSPIWILNTRASICLCVDSKHCVWIILFFMKLLTMNLLVVSFNFLSLALTLSPFLSSSLY